MKKGFTLIELLAVIVILAIIALIATPIILGIINDARKESNERSVELYASAVRNAIASYQLTNPNAPESFEDLDIEYDRNVECETEELYSDGSFYIANCTVNGNEVDYIYGEQQELVSTQVYKPQYYAWDLEGTVGSTNAPSNPSTVPPTGKTVYFGYNVLDGKISEGYVCFIRKGTEYCLKGTIDGSAYEKNLDILAVAFEDVENACSDNSSYACFDDSLTVDVGSDGGVSAYDTFQCYVYGGDFTCYNK